MKKLNIFILIVFSLSFMLLGLAGSIDRFGIAAIAVVNIGLVVVKLWVKLFPECFSR